MLQGVSGLSVDSKDEWGTQDYQGSPDWTVQPRKKFGSQGRFIFFFFCLIRVPVRDQGNGSGQEWGSFLSVGRLFYGLEANSNSSEMIYILIRQRIKETMTNKQQTQT